MGATKKAQYALSELDGLERIHLATLNRSSLLRLLLLTSACYFYFSMNISMKRLLLLCGVAAAIPGMAQAGTAPDNMDAQLRLWIHNPGAFYEQSAWHQPTGGTAMLRPADPIIQVLFKVNSGNAQALVAKHGGTLHSTIGPICTAEFPLSSIAAFAAEPEIARVESPKEVKFYNEKGKELIGADKVQTGQLPGNIPYTGKGVIVGVVDTGIDFLHLDFRNRDNSEICRVQFIWDQTAQTGVQPESFAYGAEWTQEQIQAEVQGASGVITERDSSGHGTHVAGTAAGLRGIAYDADIISVKTPLVSNGDYKFTTSAKTLDAVNYIYRKAADLGKPCVVNMSLGFGFGAPHDGTSLFEQGIDYMVNSRPGFIVCASAGNEGSSYSHHGGYALTADSVWTYVNTLNGATWYAVADSKYDDSIYVSVIMDSATASFTGQGILNQQQLFQSPWMKLKDIKDADEFYYPIVYGNGDTAATVRLVAASYDETRTELYIYPRDRFVVTTDSATAKVNLYKIAFKGAGSFHAWTQSLNGLGVNLSGFRAKTNSRFKASDSKYTIGIPATAHNVVAVGAYVNRANYTDILGHTQQGLNYSKQASGTLAFFSSIGPTIDGRMKPEFSAPGLNVASSLSRYATVDSTEMLDVQTAVFSGTSMSCPMTVGAVALYLEQHPAATYEELTAAIDSTTIKDNFTKTSGSLPNNVWGYGKLDIFRAMGGLPVTGIAEYPAATRATLYPHPTRDAVTFRLPSTAQWKSIQISDVTGRAVYATPVATQQFSIDTHSWNAGMYFYRIEGTSQTLYGEFIVQ